MALQNDKQFQMRVSEDFLRMIDDWRRIQPSLPSRAEAIRQLIQRGFDLSLLCIDLLDAIEAEGLLDTGDMKEPVAALEKYLGTSRSGDFPQK